MMTFQEYLEEKTNHSTGTYVQAKPDKTSKDKLATWLKGKQIPGLIDKDDYHVTIMYSTKGIPSAQKYTIPLPLNAKIIGWEIFSTQMPGTGKCLVALLDSKDLHKHHDHYIKAYGAVYTYDEYKPHITISYSYTGDVPKDVPHFDMRFDKTTFEPLNSNWQSDIKAKGRAEADEGKGKRKD